ncbi:MAG: dihydroneopterin aldolase [Bacteroides sp.]|nr:dihydroneopterin aldolase [Bacteroides sp.]MCM1379197.1 dihydroneopterin aldolase [Bacteroides sp.]MCM1445154.1 dihydroneopterin aldolase [Prevotella sp.]
MKVLINRLRVHACHGVLPVERVVGQDFEVSVTLDVDYDGSDRLESTVDYAAVCGVIKRAMQTPSALIEHVATQLVLALRKDFPQIRGGELTLAKLNPPMPFDVESVAVSLRF